MMMFIGNEQVMYNITRKWNLSFIPKWMPTRDLHNVIFEQ